MFQFQISCLLFICFLTLNIYGEYASNFNKLKNTKHLTLTLKEPSADDDAYVQIEVLAANNSYYLHIESIPAWVQFIVLQTHAHLHNVTLGYALDKVPGRYVTGRNIGLVQNVTSSGAAQFFLYNDNPFQVNVLLAVVPYGKDAPVPGGCNMEFEVETAPWLRVNVTGPTVAVSSQPAMGPRVWGIGGSCDHPNLHYEAYHLYLPEKDFLKDTYFSYIQRMLTVKRVIQNGRKVKDSLLSSSMRHVYSAYHGTGSVYAVVAYASSSQYTAYVPAFTYTCNPSHYTDSCQVLTSTFSRSLCALVLFVGLFICFFGHSFFQTELFLTSTMIGGIISYMLIAPYSLADSTNVLIATVGGVALGNCWLLLWWVFGSPLLSILMASLALGFLLTSVLFYSFLADVPYMASDVNYWLVFLSCMLAVTVLFAPMPNRVNILACCVVGAYAAIVPIDLYVGANLKYIFINTVRRATVPGFNEAIIDPPFQTKDTILAFLWLMLAIVGFIVQSQRFGDRPAFPPSAQPWPPSTPSASRTPLLSEQRPLLYGLPVTHSPGSDSVFT